MNQTQQTNKKSFLLYLDTYEVIKNFGVKDKASLLDSIFLYSANKPIPKLSPAAGVAFGFIKQNLDRDNEKYLGICGKNRENIAKRWNKIPKDTTEYDRIRPDTKHTHIDNDNDIRTNKMKETERLSEKPKAYKDNTPRLDFEKLALKSSQIKAKWNR